MSSSRAMTGFVPVMFTLFPVPSSRSIGQNYAAYRKRVVAASNFPTPRAMGFHSTTTKADGMLLSAPTGILKYIFGLGVVLFLARLNSRPPMTLLSQKLGVCLLLLGRMTCVIFPSISVPTILSLTSCFAAIGLVPHTQTPVVLIRARVDGDMPPDSTSCTPRLDPQPSMAMHHRKTTITGPRAYECIYTRSESVCVCALARSYFPTEDPSCCGIWMDSRSELLSSHPSVV